MTRRFTLLTATLALMLLAAVPAQAQPQGYQSEPQPQAPANARKIKSGTGFFLSNVGHIVTNEHVVNGCTNVKIRGSVSSMNARVIGVDTERDLALLLADVRPRRIANLRENRG